MDTLDTLHALSGEGLKDGHLGNLGHFGQYCGHHGHLGCHGLGTKMKARSPSQFGIIRRCCSDTDPLGQLLYNYDQLFRSIGA